MKLKFSFNVTTCVHFKFLVSFPASAAQKGWGGGRRDVGGSENEIQLQDRLGSNRTPPELEQAEQRGSVLPWAQCPGSVDC